MLFLLDRVKATKYTQSSELDSNIWGEIAVRLPDRKSFGSFAQASRYACLVGWVWSSHYPAHPPPPIRRSIQESIGHPLVVSDFAIRVFGTEAYQQLIQQGAPFPAIKHTLDRIPCPEDALITATSLNRVDIVRYFVENKNRFVFDEKFQYAAALIASPTDCDGVLELLLDGYKLDITRDEGVLLKVAVLSHSLKTAELLLRKGADPRNDEILSDAAGECDLEMFNVLVEYGADPWQFEMTYLSAVATGCIDIMDFIYPDGLREHDEVRAHALVVAADNLPAMKHLWKDTEHVDEGNSALVQACSNGNQAIVSFLLNAGVDPNSQNGLSLVLAAQDGHLASVQLLVHHGANVHSQDDEALFQASRHHFSDVVTFLVLQGAYTKSRDDEPLYQAIRYGDLTLARFLLERGADPNGRSLECLRYAVSRGFSPIVEALFEHGASTKDAPFDLLVEATQTRSTEMVHLLILHGALEHFDIYKSFVVACRMRKATIVQIFLDYGGNPNVDDYRPFFAAVESGDLPTINLLYHSLRFRSGNARVQAPQDGKQPSEVLRSKKELSEVIVTAVGTRNLATVKALVGLGFDVHWNDDSAFILSCWNADIEMVQFLISQGARVNIRDNFPIQAAVMVQSAPLLRLLLDQGASVHGSMGRSLLLKAAHGGDVELFVVLHTVTETPDAAYLEILMQEACKGGHLEVMIFLNSLGCPFDANNGACLEMAALHQHGPTVCFLMERGVSQKVGQALVGAVRSGSIVMADFLLEKGADPSYNNGEPLLAAVTEKNMILVHLLFQYGASPTQELIEKARSMPDSGDLLNELLRAYLLNRS